LVLNSLVRNKLMNELRRGLGGQTARTGLLPEHGLTLHELAELVRRAGRAAGFIVESEYKVLPETGRKGKIDWVWQSAKSLKPVVAFEIEGRDASPTSVVADVAKFRECGAGINVIALFQVDHNRTPKSVPPHGLSPQAWVRQVVGEFPVEILLDVDLMAPGGIERLQERAVTLNRSAVES
jgi:hypothetical protein